MPIQPVHNEKELLLKISNSNEQAFAELFHAYNKPLAEYVHKITESWQMTEDIVQDVFIKIWLKRDQLSALESFTDYLFILSRNQTIDSLRKKNSDRLRSLDWARQFEQQEEASDTESIIEAYRTLIEEAIELLPPQQKKTYLLSRQRRLKHHEIATQLNISQETVKKHIQLALHAITHHVRGHIDMAIILILLSSY